MVGIWQESEGEVIFIEGYQVRKYSVVGFDGRTAKKFGEIMVESSNWNVVSDRNFDIRYSFSIVI